MSQVFRKQISNTSGYIGFASGSITIYSNADMRAEFIQIVAIILKCFFFEQNGLHTMAKSISAASSRNSRFFDIDREVPSNKSSSS